jgi:DNA-binding XRE family transcriptional regulator
MFPHEQLHDIKQRRQAILPDSRAIGTFLRLPQYVGRAVTQEELAETLGISREWYCALENGKCTNASPELVSKIVRALYDRREARRFEWNPKDVAAMSLAEIRRYMKRISSASNYVDAALEAIATGNRLLATTCVGVINFESDGKIYGHAFGPREHLWKPLCDEVVRDAHRALRAGGVGVNDNIPTADDVLASPSVFLSFESPTECHSDYDYECSSDRWRDFNGDLGIRSVIAVALRDRHGYRGTLAFAWSERRSVHMSEIEIVRNLAAALELIS